MYTVKLYFIPTQTLEKTYKRPDLFEARKVAEMFLQDWMNEDDEICWDYGDDQHRASFCGSEGPGDVIAIVQKEND